MQKQSEVYISKRDHFLVLEDVKRIIDKFEVECLLRLRNVRTKCTHRIRRRDHAIVALKEQLTTCQLRPSVYKLEPIAGQPLEYILKDDHEKACKYACDSINQMLLDHATELRKIGFKHEKARAISISTIDGLEEKLRNQEEYIKLLLTKQGDGNMVSRRAIRNLESHYEPERFPSNSLPIESDSSSSSSSSGGTNRSTVIQHMARTVRTRRPVHNCRARGVHHRADCGKAQCKRRTSSSDFLRFTQMTMTARAELIMVETLDPSTTEVVGFGKAQADIQDDDNAVDETPVDVSVDHVNIGTALETAEHLHESVASHLETRSSLVPSSELQEHGLAQPLSDLILQFPQPQTLADTAEQEPDMQSRDGTHTSRERH